MIVRFSEANLELFFLQVFNLRFAKQTYCNIKEMKYFCLICHCFFVIRKLKTCQKAVPSYATLET